MNSGVNKCITMRLLKNILHFILIININKALKLTLSNKQILLNTMNASHLRTKFWVIMIKYILVNYWIIQYINCSFKLNTIGPLITIHSRKQTCVYVLYMSWSVCITNICTSFKYTSYIFLDQWNKIINMYMYIYIFHFQYHIMALNNLLDQDKKIWISHCGKTSN